MNNYELSRNRAQAYFLGFDQQRIIDTWRLQADSDFLYVNFLSRPYRVCRKTGSIFRCWDDSQAGFEEVLSIFDLLCHEGSGKHISGSYAPVNSLKGRPRAIGVGTDFHTKTAALLERNLEAFRAACVSLGGTEVPMGDIGFRFPLFQELHLILKFYQSDEEFPATLTLLWDENLLQYVYYETVFYIAGFFLETIVKKAQQHGG